MQHAQNWWWVLSLEKIFEILCHCFYIMNSLQLERISKILKGTKLITCFELLYKNEKKAKKVRHYDNLDINVTWCPRSICFFIISPIVSRARQRLEQPTKESSKGLFSFLSSTLIWRSKTKEKSNKNMFLDPRMHHNYDCCSSTNQTDHCVAHQFSDSGRIANRYDNSRWDVW